MFLFGCDALSETGQYLLLPWSKGINCSGRQDPSWAHILAWFEYALSSAMDISWFLGCYPAQRWAKLYQVIVRANIISLSWFLAAFLSWLVWDTISMFRLPKIMFRSGKSGGLIVPRILLAEMYRPPSTEAPGPVSVALLQLRLSHNPAALHFHFSLNPSTIPPSFSFRVSFSCCCQTLGPSQTQVFWTQTPQIWTPLGSSTGATNIDEWGRIQGWLCPHLVFASFLAPRSSILSC